MKKFTEIEYKDALRKSYKISYFDTYINFLIDKCWKDNNRVILMAGDLGKAYSKIADLQAKISTLSNKPND